ncbi:MAG: hypothetical protein KKA28_08955, partial [Planctomycetes bacterium]|nr:hypothetical protein [Planctomycetota bacterium]
CLPLGLGSSILLEVIPLTGEPDAGNPHVRFGGRGGRTQSAFPTPIKDADEKRGREKGEE